MFQCKPCNQGIDLPVFHQVIKTFLCFFQIFFLRHDFLLCRRLTADRILHFLLLDRQVVFFCHQILMFFHSRKDQKTRHEKEDQYTGKHL